MDTNRKQQNKQQKPGENKQQKPGAGFDIPNRSAWRTFIWIIIASVVALWLWNFSGRQADRATPINYSRFRQHLKAGEVEQVVVTGERIQGKLKKPAEKQVSEDETVKYTDFVTYLPSFGDEELLSILETERVEVETKPESDFPWWAILANFLPFLLLIGIGLMFFRRMQSQGQGIFSVGRSRAKLYEQRKERTTFDDVAGARGAKTELKEIIEFLKNPDRFQQLGGETPKGVILVGPPGTGKTLLARAVAGEAEVPFFSITGSDFMEMFVGVGASRVRSMFEQAKKRSPAIIFIDEIDSIGRRRGAGLGGGHDEREQTLNQLLSELDGFEPNESVIVMAATNRPDILDPALLRPGRFDRRITVELPTTEAREEILKIHARNKPLADDVDLQQIARGTPGFSGADLENLLNEAALLAARKEKKVIEREDVEEARDKVMMGLKREGLALTDEELELIAYHEAGHAILAGVLPNADPIHKVTIVPRGRAMGVTQQLPERDKYIYPQEYLLDRMTVILGGRAAEKLVFNTSTSGSENDLKEVTRLARQMVLNWGMSPKFEHIAFGDERQQVFLGSEIAHRREYSDSTAREVDEEVKTILDDSYEHAINTLREHREALERVAKALLEKEEIPGEEILKLIGVEKEKSSVESEVDEGQLD
jgi:cell division protease FtsH